MAVKLTSTETRQLWQSMQQSLEAQESVRQKLKAAGDSDDVETAIANLIGKLPADEQADSESRLREALGQGSG